MLQATVGTPQSNGGPLDDWVTDTAAALGLPAPSTDDTRALLELVREVAHGVCRPAGAVAAYLVGVAVGQGTDADTAHAVVRTLVPEQAR
ncbi:DUF6457 domain-containing protein [Micromonospora sp. MS34]|uniref:DUF6457 domain-containing protein n=1 Tax=Micromonospora sp. MS34 TaxID=3385971 RepID=UPI0039A17804